MLRQDVELGVSHVDLGGLNEFALLCLFGSAICRRITAGLPHSIRGLTDKDGKLLYPAFFATHLKVPPARPIEEHAVFSTVTVGADVKSFGGMMLESAFVLGRPGEIGDDPDGWDHASFASMRGGTLFIKDEGRETPQPSTPRPGAIAELPKITRPPELMARFARIQEQGWPKADIGEKLRPSAPIPYSLVTGRDIAAGHAVMFATFTKIMDYAERVLFAEHVWPRFPAAVLDCLRSLERETYYLANTLPGQRILVDVAARISACPREISDQTGKRSGVLPIAVFDLDFELYEEARNTLLVVSRARKLLAIPTAQLNMLRDAERLVTRHSASPSRGTSNG